MKAQLQEDDSSQYWELRQRLDQLEQRQTIAIGYFRANRSSTLASVASGGVAVAMNQELEDVNDWFDPSNGRYTPQLRGFYLLITRISILTSLANDVRLYAGNLRHTTVDSVQQGQICRSLSGNDNLVTATSIAEANGTTDYFSAYLNHSNGSDVSIRASADTEFQGFYIGDKI